MLRGILGRWWRGGRRKTKVENCSLFGKWMTVLGRRKRRKKWVCVCVCVRRDKEKLCRCSESRSALVMTAAQTRRSE